MPPKSAAAKKAPKKPAKKSAGKSKPKTSKPKVGRASPHVARRACPPARPLLALLTRAPLLPPAPKQKSTPPKSAKAKAKAKAKPKAGIMRKSKPKYAHCRSRHCAPRPRTDAS